MLGLIRRPASLAVTAASLLLAVRSFTSLTFALAGWFIFAPGRFPGSLALEIRQPVTDTIIFVSRQVRERLLVGQAPVQITTAGLPWLCRLLFTTPRGTTCQFCHLVSDVVLGRRHLEPRNTEVHQITSVQGTEVVGVEFQLRLLLGLAAIGLVGHTKMKPEFPGLVPATALCQPPVKVIVADSNELRGCPDAVLSPRFWAANAPDTLALFSVSFIVKGALEVLPGSRVEVLEEIRVVLQMDPKPRH